jgi:hypothetical protein
MLGKHPDSSLARLHASPHRRQDRAIASCAAAPDLPYFLLMAPAACQYRPGRFRAPLADRGGPATDQIKPGRRQNQQGAPA